jgi:cell division septation protein DedD
MMDIAAHIGELVRENELVIIPGLGGFLTHFHAAQVNAVSKKIEAPGRHIVFNAQLKDNDGFLAHSFAKKMNISYKDALYLVETFSTFCWDELKMGNQISFEKLGLLSMSTTGHIQFSADLSINYDDQYFGLPEINATPIIRNRTYDPVIQINPQAKENIRRIAPLYRKIAADAIPLVTLGVVAWFSKGHITNYYQQSASVLSIDSSTNSENLTNTESKTKTISANEIEAKTTHVDSNLIPEPKEMIVKEQVESFDGKFHIIGGAFNNKDLAEKLIKELEADGFKAYIAGQNKNGLYRVSAGNFNSRSKAVEQLKWFQNQVNSSAWLLNEEL